MKHTVINTMRWAIPIGLLLFQVTMIVYARFDAGRYYTWAPHDAQNQYRIYAEIDGRQLTRREVYQRFRYSRSGNDPRAIEHVVRAIEHHLRLRGEADGMRVLLTYRVNGGALQTRRWPADAFLAGEGDAR